MTFNELHPTIQSWINSDEFIGSIVSVTRTFSLPSSSILINAIFDLILKIVKPEEFKTKLFASLPPDKQNENIINELVSFSLLPIKAPLLESGIDITIIAPISNATLVTSEAVTLNTSDNYPTENITLNNNASLTPNTTYEAPINFTPITANTDTSPIPSSPPAPPTQSILPTIEETLPIATTIASPSVIENIAPPIASSPIIPNFVPDSISPETNNPPITPFVIYEEKSIETAMSSSNHIENPLRPMFYTGESTKQESSPVANIEFRNPEDNKQVNANNIINLKDLPL